MSMKRLIIEVAVALAIVGGALLVAAGAEPQRSQAERQQFIAECEGNGGIPVVVAGVLASRGIACAQPLGN